MNFPITDTSWNITHVIFNNQIYEWKDNKIGRKLTKKEVKEFLTINY
jgi:hypothetical protein